MPAKKPLKALRPPKELHGKPVRVVGFKVEELPFLTFYGRDWEDLKHNVKAELARRYPEGYTLETPETLAKVFDN